MQININNEALLLLSCFTRYICLFKKCISYQYILVTLYVVGLYFLLDINFTQSSSTYPKIGKQ